MSCLFFFFNDTATTEIYTLSLHDALPIWEKAQRIIEAMRQSVARRGVAGSTFDHVAREAGVSRGLLHYYFADRKKHTSELQSRQYLVCRLLLEKKKIKH